MFSLYPIHYSRQAEVGSGRRGEEGPTRKVVLSMDYPKLFISFN